jgi:hypothetical protein
MREWIRLGVLVGIGTFAFVPILLIIVFRTGAMTQGPCAQGLDCTQVAA